MLVDVKTRSAYRAATRSRIPYHFAKRCTDIIVSFTLLIICMPIFLFICYRINKQERKPIFHRELCAGVEDRSFIMHTFRTMTVRSKVIRALPPHPYPESWDDGVPDQFTFRFPQVATYTSIGLWLEKYRLDKLPLLYHVLIGNMSLVGPAPELYEIASYYNEHQSERLQVKPGITGYAQITGHSADRYHKKVQADIYYVQNRSYLLDMKIIVKAFAQIFLK